ncbi:MAG: tetratricopeptide repeat protein [Oscillatoriales cyanobacterium SM2_1_8]|nr:tetratricopeptide repeat protein [Oscillatoriales cyanobacterium SM2_1_8]
MATVLLVCENIERSSLWQAALLAQGVQVEVAASDTPLVPFLQGRADQPDAVLVDMTVRSPDGNSLQASDLCRWAKTQAVAPKIFVLNDKTDTAIKEAEQRWATRQGAEAMLPRLSGQNLPTVLPQVLAVLGLLYDPGQAQGLVDTQIAPTPRRLEEPTGLQPTDAAGYFRAGLERYQRGDYQEALNAFYEAVRRDAALVEAHRLRGEIYLKLGNIDKAIASLDKAIEVDPKSVVSYCSRAGVRYRLGDNQGAIADANQALKLDPQCAIAANERGLAKLASGDERGALQDYNTAIKHNKNFAQAYNNRGTLRATQGDLNGALADYAQALRADPNFADAYYNRGNVYSDRGEFAKAIADYNEALRANPKFAQAYGNRGIAHYETDRPKEAIADTRQAIELFRQMGDETAAKQAEEVLKQMA